MAFSGTRFKHGLKQGIYLFPRIYKSSTCHYEILEIPRNSSKSEIRKAFLEQTKKYHPDKDLSDDTLHGKFVKVTQAYQVLGDVHSRNIYDGTSHPNVVFEQRRHRTTNTSSTNPFGQYQEAAYSEHDPESQRRMYEEMKNHYAEYENLQKNAEDRKQRNVILLLMLSCIIAGLTYLNFTRIMSFHQGYMTEMDRRTIINAAFLNNERTGYKSYIKAIKEKEARDK